MFRRLFDGRISRRDFLLGSLFLLGLLIVGGGVIGYSVLDQFLIAIREVLRFQTPSATPQSFVSQVLSLKTSSLPFGSLIAIPLLVLLIQALIIFTFVLGFSLLIRRLHDIGQTGLWSLLILIAPINLILLVILLLKKGDPRENNYGAVSLRKNLIALLINK